MKLHLALAVLLVGEVLAENVFEPSDSCHDITSDLEKLNKNFLSSSCDLQFSESTESTAGGGKLYEKYARICRAFCPDKCKAPFTYAESFTKKLDLIGDCGSIEKGINDFDVDVLSGCIESADLPDYILNPLCGIGGGYKKKESICSGYYKSCDKHLKSSVDGNNRSLEEIVNVSHDAVIKVMDKADFESNGVYAKEAGILPEDACANARHFLDEKEANIRAKDPMGKKVSPRITGEELIEIVGKENAKKLLEFFHDTLGYEAPVTLIKFQRVDNGDDFSYFKPHKDGAETLITFLKPNGDDSDLVLGGLSHVSGNDSFLTDKVTTGLTIVHGKDVVHASHPWKGVRDILKIASNPRLKDLDCMLSDLVN